MLTPERLLEIADELMEFVWDTEAGRYSDTDRVRLAARRIEEIAYEKNPALRRTREEE